MRVFGSSNSTSSLLYSRCSGGGFFVMPSIILFRSETFVFSLASKNIVVFLRRIIRNTSMVLIFIHYFRRKVCLFVFAGGNLGTVTKPTVLTLPWRLLRGGNLK